MFFVSKPFIFFNIHVPWVVLVVTLIVQFSFGSCNAVTVYDDIFKLLTMLVAESYSLKLMFIKDGKKSIQHFFMCFFSGWFFFTANSDVQSSWRAFHTVDYYIINFFLSLFLPFTLNTFRIRTFPTWRNASRIYNSFFIQFNQIRFIYFS